MLKFSPHSIKSDRDMESNEAFQTSETNPADFVKHEQEEIQK